MGKKVCLIFTHRCYIPKIPRISFNITLLLAAIFILAAGASTNGTTLIALAAVWSVGVGGNLPVDSAIFLGESTYMICTCL